MLVGVVGVAACASPQEADVRAFRAQIAYENASDLQRLGELDGSAANPDEKRRLWELWADAWHARLAMTCANVEPGLRSYADARLEEAEAAIAEELERRK